jgi:hypothetical protein
MEIELPEVPDHLKAIATEADGKFKLNLAGLVPASELETFKGKAVTAQQEAIDRRKQLEAWKKLGESPEEIQAKLAKGADPAIIDQMRQQHAQEIAARDGKLTQVLSRVATSELKAELSKAGVVPEGLDLLASFAAPRIQFDEDGNARVMAADGKTPMVGGGANGGATLADLAKELAKTIPHLVKDAGTGGSGKQPGSAGTAGKTMTRAAFDALSPKDRAAAMKDGTTITD